MSDLIKLTPIFHEKIWGGRQLETVFGYDIPDGPIGECWAISAHPNGDCQIAEGPYAGHTLSWLWAEHRELFGNCEGKEFPLLIKILDAKDDLSIQIHPNDEYAAKHENGSLGKTECWYVLDCEPGATIIVGQRAHDRAEAAQMIEDGRWDDMLNVLPIHKGDFFQIDSGTVHAIKTGTLILETQQSSDVTYRLYDYDRPGTDGKLRPLHIEQSLDCINFDAQAPTDGTVTAPEVDGVTELESNPCYTVDRVRVDGSKTLDQRWPFMCLSVIDGEGTICGDPVHKGSHLLAPSTVLHRPRRQDGTDHQPPLGRTNNPNATRGSPVHIRGSPYSYLSISPPGSPDQKADEQSNVRPATLPKDPGGRMGQHRSRVPHAKEAT